MSIAEQWYNYRITDLLSNIGLAYLIPTSTGTTVSSVGEELDGVWFVESSCRLLKSHDQPSLLRPVSAGHAESDNDNGCAGTPPLLVRATAWSCASSCLSRVSLLSARAMWCR